MGYTLCTGIYKCHVHANVNRFRLEVKLSFINTFSSIDQYKSLLTKADVGN